MSKMNSIFFVNLSQFTHINDATVKCVLVMKNRIIEFLDSDKFIDRPVDETILEKRMSMNDCVHSMIYMGREQTASADEAFTAYRICTLCGFVEAKR